MIGGMGVPKMNSLAEKLYDLEISPIAPLNNSSLFLSISFSISLFMLLSSNVGLTHHLNSNAHGSDVSRGSTDVIGFYDTC